MTLIISHVTNLNFACVTSDTMMRTILTDPTKVLGDDDNYTSNIEERDKSSLLTDNVIISESGLADITEAVIRQLEKKIKRNMFLEDCIPLLKESRKEVEEIYSKDSFFVNNISGPHYAITLTGFYDNERTGQVTLDHFGVSSRICEDPLQNKSISGVMVNSPTQDIEDLVETFKNLLYEAADYEELFDYYENIHTLVAATHPEMVSATFKRLLLFKDEQGKIVSQTVTKDLSEKVDYYKKALISIKQDK